MEVLVDVISLIVAQQQVEATKFPRNGTCSFLAGFYHLIYDKFHGKGTFLE